MHSEPAHSDTRTVMKDSHHAGGRGRKVMERAVDEMRRFMVMFLYLWILFGLFALYQRILFAKKGSILPRRASPWSMRSYWQK